VRWDKRKGIEGIYVDDNLEGIDLLQSKISTSTTKSDLGDSQLRECVGAVSHFTSGVSAQAIANTTGNIKLQNITGSIEKFCPLHSWKEHLWPEACPHSSLRIASFNQQKFNL